MREGGGRRARRGEIRRIQSKRRKVGGRGVTEWDREVEEGGAGPGRDKKTGSPA